MTHRKFTNYWRNDNDGEDGNNLYLRHIHGIAFANPSNLIRKIMMNPIQAFAALYMKLKNADPIPVTFGKGVAATLAKPIEDAGYKSVFIACSRTINRENMLRELIEKLNEKGIKTTVFSDIVPDPTIQNVEAGLKVLKANNCDCVVAAGGGSVIDCAKVIALRATNSWMPVSAMAIYIRPLCKSLPLFVLPSTSGTGSEVTYFSVITDDVNHKKFLASYKYFTPAVVYRTDYLFCSLAG